MKRIYFNDKIIIIQEDKTKENPSAEEIKKCIDKVNAVDSTSDIIIKCGNEEKTLIVLFSFYKEVLAAGGVVINDKDEILFIFRKGKWDLPKGKIDNGETAEKAAIREVKEECGLKNLEIIEQLPFTYHTYKEDHKSILKQTYWYLMKTGDSHLNPQLEEGITKTEWINRNQLQEVMNNTYGSIRDVIETLKIR